MNYRAHIDTDAVEYAARNHPTENYNLRPTGEIRGGRVVRQRPELVQRRKLDARIFKNMTPAQETAFELIYYGWKVRASDVAMKSGFNLLRVDGGRKQVNPERAAEMSRRYFEWAKACAGEGIRNAPIIFMISECQGVKATAKLYRMDDKRVMPNLLAGLDLYCELHGMRG
jgi:hypothetical protein